MATTTKVPYFLPKTMVRLHSRMRRLTDGLDPARSICEPSDWIAELVTVADRDRSYTVTITGSWWSDYGAKLGFTEDGRLASADVQSTGQVGRAVASATGLAVGVASAAIFRFPDLPVSLTQTKGVGRIESDFAPDDEGQPDTAAERYAAECPGDARRLKALRAEHRETVMEVAQARVEYREQQREVDRDDAWSHYRRSVEVAAEVAAELDQARRLFNAWRRSKQTITEFVEVAFVPVSALPMLTKPQNSWNLDWGEDQTSAEVHRFFNAVGWVLAHGGRQDLTLPVAPSTESKTPADDLLHVLRPRPVELVALRQDSTGELHPVEYRRELIMDEGCQEVTVPLRKSWLAKRKTAVELSPSGALTRLEFGATSNGQQAASMASSMGASAVAAIESAEKAREALGALEAADKEEALPRE